MTSPTTSAVKQTVAAMINELGMLRKLVALDNQPIELLQIRQLLRELDAKLPK